MGKSPLFKTLLRFRRRPLVRGIAALITLIVGLYVLWGVPDLLPQLRTPTTWAELIVLAALIYPVGRAAVSLFAAIVTLSRTTVLGPMIALGLWLIFAAVGPGLFFLAHKTGTPIFAVMGIATSVLALQLGLMLLRIGFEDVDTLPSLPRIRIAPLDLFTYADQQEELAARKAAPIPPLDYAELQSAREAQRDMARIARMPMRMRILHI